MIVYKCKMCGGDLEVTEGSKIATCEYCMTQQSIPSADDEKRANMYNRANHFRQNGEFDRAMGIYEQILSDDVQDAEVYWEVVLCKFGIQYVEDPATKERKPTVNRTQTASILGDPDYQKVLELADVAQRQLFEYEAAEIERIQREILSIAKSEEPYDIFISYKEKAKDGNRTTSSVIAQDIYDRLTKEGYRVFFSRISLETVIGRKYEPYIYSALNSAKVMLVVGTNKEEFEAPWVRNEWSRFLNMMRGNLDKFLIPCFRDMDAYDLPEEFQTLQAQDMSKVGFEQDLIRGIHKICAKQVKAKPVIRQTTSSSPMENVADIDSLLERLFICLSDGDFKKADELADTILSRNPHNAKAYLARLMIEHGIINKEKLSDALIPISGSDNYKHIMEYGDSDLIAFCKEQDQVIVQKNAQEIYILIEQKEKELQNKNYALSRDIGMVDEELKEIDEKESAAYQRRTREVESNKKAKIPALLIGVFLIVLAVSIFSSGLKSCSTGKISDEGFGLFLFVLSGIPGWFGLIMTGSIFAKAESLDSVKKIDEEINQIQIDREQKKKNQEKLKEEKTLCNRHIQKMDKDKQLILQELAYLPRGHITANDVFDASNGKKFEHSYKKNLMLVKSSN